MNSVKMNEQRDQHPSANDTQSVCDIIVGFYSPRSPLRGPRHPANIRECRTMAKSTKPFSRSGKRCDAWARPKHQGPIRAGQAKFRPGWSAQGPRSPLQLKIKAARRLLEEALGLKTFKAAKQCVEQALKILEAL